MKKILLGAIVFATINAWAGGPELLSSTTPTATFSGPYVGIGAGAVLGDFDLSMSTNAINAGAPPIYTLGPLTGNHDLHSANAIGTIFVGYGVNFFQRFNLGAEIYGSLHKASISESIAAAGKSPNALLANSTHMSLSNGEIGMDLRPGFILSSNTLLYARVGAALNKVHFDSSVIANQADIVPTNASLNYGNSKTKAGLRLGVGMEQMITNNLSLRADYIFTTYGSLSENAITSFPAPLNQSTLISSTNLKVRTHTVMASLSYYFGNLI